MVPRAARPKVEVDAHAVRAAEEEIRRELAMGKALAELISLPVGDGDSA